MELLIAFTDESESFTNGVEFGRILAALELGEEAVSNQRFPVHLANKEVIKAACKQYGYTPCFTAEHFEEWVEFIGIKKSTSEN